jgi:hypothetical protein
MTSLGTGSPSSAGCRAALDRPLRGLLGGPGQLAACRVGLTTVEELARIQSAAAREEKAMIQHGFRYPFLSIIVVDMGYSSILLSLCQYRVSLFAR